MSRRGRPRWATLGIWLLFTVVITLLPVASSVSSQLTDGRVLSLAGTIGRGELFLSAVALCGATGEDIARRRARALPCGSPG